MPVDSILNHYIASHLEILSICKYNLCITLMTIHTIYPPSLSLPSLSPPSPLFLFLLPPPLLFLLTVSWS